MATEQEIAKIISQTREVENILKNKFKAQGNGLHQYISFVENQLSQSLLKDLRYLATIRNSAMHEHDFQIKDINRYVAVAQKSMDALNAIDVVPKMPTRDKNYTPKIPRRRTKRSKFLSFRFVFLIILGILIYLTDSFNAKPNKPLINDETFINKESNALNISNKSSTHNKFFDDVEQETPKEVFGSYQCSQDKIYCSSMSSYEEAKWHLDNCQGTKMDGDGDGIPCESQF